MKHEGHLGRCCLKARLSDTANAILSALGHNCRRIVFWSGTFLPSILNASFGVIAAKQA